MDGEPTCPLGEAVGGGSPLSMNEIMKKPMFTGYERLEWIWPQAVASFCRGRFGPPALMLR